MIHLFNRKEFILTWDMSELSKIRDILASNNVEYIVRTRNMSRTSPFDASSRGRTGTLGMRTDAMYQYTIYVRKEDYERARVLIGR